MSIRIFALALLALTVGCTVDPPPRARTDDMFAAPSACQTRTDCRLFSSYCKDAPCQCIALGTNEVTPTCTATVSCNTDPCHDRLPACTNGICDAPLDSAN